MLDKRCRVVSALTFLAGLIPLLLVSLFLGATILTASLSLALLSLCSAIWKTGCAWCEMLTATRKHLRRRFTALLDRSTFMTALRCQRLLRDRRSRLSLR